MTALNAFHRGDKALFTADGTSHIVTIVEVIDKSTNSEYAILTADGDQWYARENQLTPLAGGCDPMSTQAIVRLADAEVANGEATVAVVYLLDKRAVHVVCSCCGTVSTDTYAADTSDDEMFTVRWDANVRANTHARHGTHRAERITCGTCAGNGAALTAAGESVVAFFARYGIGGAR